MKTADETIAISLTYHEAGHLAAEIRKVKKYAFFASLPELTELLDKIEKELNR